jgi:3-phosphoshikimate 1-carboxyvinyltransferase
MTEKSVIKNIELSEDILATLDCLRALGAFVELTDGTITVGGLNPDRFPEGASLFCRESGSTLRFFIPICLLCGKQISLFGSERLLARPQSVYEELCSENGFLFARDSEKITLRGNLAAGDYTVRGDVSSQFITGLIFALVLIGGKSRIIITEACESRSYIDLTVKALRDFGADIEFADNEIKINGDIKPENRELSVEGDYSNAAFFEALNVFGGNVKITGLDKESLQGDRVYSEIFAMKKTDYNLEDCPDLAPVAFAVAAYLGGGSFSGTRRLKIKESDRAEAMKTELAKFGIELTVLDNEVFVSGKLTPPSATLYGHNDHRIVMALSVLSTVTGGVIEGAEAVSKSLPDFFARLNALNVKTEVETL